MKCSYAAFGEQNKTDNDSKCQQDQTLTPPDTSHSTRIRRAIGVSRLE